MAEEFKVGEDSICHSCALVPSQDECIKCYTCKTVFHGICENVEDDTKVGNQTLIKQFHSKNTKNNFKFFCNICVTVLEKNIAATNDDKVKALEKK